MIDAYPNDEDHERAWLASRKSVAKVVSVAFAPTGPLLAAVYSDGVMLVWDLMTGEPRHQFPKDRCIGGSVVFSPDGRCLVTSHGTLVRVWDADTGQPAAFAAFSPRTCVVDKMTFHTDGRLIACGGDATGVQIWDVNRAAPRALERPRGLPRVRPSIRGLSFHPEGTLLASGGDSWPVRIWNVGTGQCVGEVRHEGSPMAVAYSPDGAYLAVAAERKDSSGFWSSVNILDAAGEQRLTELRGIDGMTTTLAFSSDGTMLAAAAFSGGGPAYGDRKDRRSAIVWSVPYGERLLTVDDPRYGAVVDMSPDGTWLATAHRDDGSIAIREVTTGDVVRELIPRPE